MDPNAERGKLDQLSMQMSPYQNPELFSQIQNKVMQQWNPLLSNAVQSTQNQMADYGSRFYNLLNQGLASGTDAASLNPQQKLAYLGGQLGNMAGNLQASGSLADYFGGKAGDMARNAQESAKFGYSTINDQYNRQFQIYQMAQAQAEAEKQRQFQAQQAAAARRASAGAAAFKPFNLTSEDNSAKYNPMQLGMVNNAQGNINSGMAEGYANNTNPIYNPAYANAYNMAQQVLQNYSNLGR